MSETSVPHIRYYNPKEASQAQDMYCKAHEVPHFAPDEHNGYQCYRCGQNIYQEVGEDPLFDIERNGYPVSYAQTHLITGCPFCHYSFVE